MAWEGNHVDIDSEAVPIDSAWALRVLLYQWQGSVRAAIVVVVVCVVVMRSRKLRFHVKHSAFTGIYFFFGIISVPVMLFNACDPKATKIPSLLVRRVQAPLFGISARVKGKENYPEGPFVVVCNHQSSLDCIGVMEAWPSNCVIIMKKALKYAGPFGLGAILAGTIFVDRSRSHGNGGARESLKHAVELMHQKGYRILIFPEGTRRLAHLPAADKGAVSQPMLPFKKGAFNLAILAQVPIVPVVFSSQKHLLDFTEHKFVSGEYHGNVLPPVSTHGYTLDDVPELSDKVRNIMIEHFNEMEKRLANSTQ